MRANCLLSNEHPGYTVTIPAVASCVDTSGWVDGGCDNGSNGTRSAGEEAPEDTTDQPGDWDRRAS